MLTLLLGTDWTENRRVLLDMIAADVAAEKPGRVLMVPELISHDTERRLCIAAGDTTSRFAEVLSFSRLVRRVCESIGHRMPECLDNGGRVVAMSAAVRQLHSKLKAYASVETKPEFLTGMVDAVDEFKRCCISAQDLLLASERTEGTLAQKLEELSLLLEAYDGLCQHGKRDPRDQMLWLLEQLEDCSFAADHVFYIDGFPDFTRQHMAIVEHLICRSEQVVISLNCDSPNSADLAFGKAGKTASDYIRIAKNAGVAYQIQYVQPRKDALLPLRTHLFQGPLNVQPQLAGRLKLYRANSVYDECLAAAEKIMEMVQSGVRYRQINVVCADMNAYRNVIGMVFDRCRIPAYLSGTEDILDKSVITTVLAAVDAALSGLEQKDVLRYCKSLLSPLGLAECDRLENYAIMWSISGKRWLEEWTKHPSGLDGKWTESAEKQLGGLNETRRRMIAPLERLYTAFKNAQNLKAQVEAVFGFLDEIHLDRKLADMAAAMDRQGDNRNAQILNQLWEILLSALEQMYDVIGETVWDAETFSRMLRLLLSQYDVGTIPPVLDAVTVGPVSAMRCQQQKHLIVLGALEGALPGYGGSTGILTDQERTALRAMGVPLTGGALDGMEAEFAEIYSVFCGAEESVSVFCPAGQPSFLYRRLIGLGAAEEVIERTLGAALADPAEASAFLARNEAYESARELGLEEMYSSIDHQRKHSMGKVSRENIEAIYGPMLRLSASQVDKQADCRMFYFLRYGLAAQERKSITVDPAEFGTYVHDVLEKTVLQVQQSGGFHQVSLEDTLKIAAAYSQEYAEERFSKIDSVRIDYLFRRNFQELELIIRELWQELHDSEFAPAFCELGFDDGGQLPAVDVSGKTMPALLRGFVDRVDCWSDGTNNYFRVVDYKTGRKDFDYCDVFNGLGLQMLIYMYALEQGGQQVLGQASTPAGVLYFPARAPLLSADGTLSDEEADGEREKLWRRKGLLLGTEEVLCAMEPGDVLKRLCVKRKKDGTLAGDIADSQQFRQLRTYIFGVIGKMVDDIASGNVTPNPYTRGSSHNACSYCPYGSICHKAEVTGRRNYKAMDAQKFWEEVGKELKGNG